MMVWRSPRGARLPWVIGAVVWFALPLWEPSLRTVWHFGLTGAFSSPGSYAGRGRASRSEPSGKLGNRVEEKTMTQPIRPFPRGDRRFERGLPRRVFLEQALRAGAVGAAALWTPGVLAQELATTPSSRSLEGPFYPDEMPLDTDNDLLIVNDSITPAVGEVTHLYGTVTTSAGTPLRNAFVEIWQCDANQNYRHSNGLHESQAPDANFQGYGRFLTNVKGEYYFRTIKPVPYVVGNVFRTPHIHFAVSRHGERVFTSQMLVNGHPDNARDRLTQRIEDPVAKETILVDFDPLPGSKIGELTAHFDIVLGRTVEELEDGSLGWGLGRTS